MYSYIKGKVDSINENYIVLENNDIGYEIYMSNISISNINKNVEQKVYIYQHIREDNNTLYGFSSENEKNAFMKLITVSGVGPKAGMQILSTLSYEELFQALINKDVKAFLSVKGVGKKTAERIIIDLSDKLTPSTIEDVSNINTLNSNSSVLNEAIDALMSLGFSYPDAQQAVKKALNISDDLNKVIKLALQSIGDRK